MQCLRCGSCCFSDDPDYLPVFGVDVERLGPAADGLVVARPGGRAMRIREGRCVALAHGAAPGTEGSTDGSARHCTVHAVRPDCCRWLVPGSTLCRQARRRRGLP